MYLISVFCDLSVVEFTKRFSLSEVIKYSFPYLSIPSIEKDGLLIVEIIDLSWLTTLTTPTTYEFSSITKSFSFRFKSSPPDMMYSPFKFLNIIEDSNIL